MNRKHPTSWMRGLGLGLAALLVFSVLPSDAVAAQDCGEVDDMTKATNYSLYYESFKNQDYASALPYLRWMLQCAPAYAGPNRTSDKNIERAIETYQALGQNADDPEMARAYLDTALTWFDQAIPTLEEAGVEISNKDHYQWTLNKGRFIQENSEALEDLQGEAYTLYREAYEIAPSEVPSYYLQLVVYDFVRNDDKQGAVDVMEEIESDRGDDEELMNYIAQVRNSLFKTPEERMAFLEGQLEKNPEDGEIIAELFEIYMDLGYRDEMYGMGERLLESAPTARTYQLLGKARLDDGEAEAAMEMYEQALELPGAESAMRDIYYNMGIAQQQMEQLRQARSYFRQALEVDSDFGPALIAIGDLYVSAVSSCGGAQMEREDQAVYWLAADYYDRAASRDDAVARQARSKLNNIRPYFPNQEALFFKNWQAGQSYGVDYGCYAWIGETTRVRTP